jgi:glycosyltransferase involved in cell wall biosynthesis
MKRLLLINRVPLGHHTVSYQLCLHLRDAYAITYLCFDYGFPKTVLEGVDVHYVSNDGTKPVRFLRFLTAIRRTLAGGGFAVVFAAYFQGSALIRSMAGSTPVVLHIDTGSVQRGSVVRHMENALLALESRAFRSVTILTEGFLQPLRLNAQRCHVLPLGAMPHGSGPRDFSALRLLYVGTLHNRFIEKTVQGFHRFCAETTEGSLPTYDIIGDGAEEDVSRLRQAIDGGLHAGRIQYHGRLPHDELGPFFEQCTTGVSFVPLTPYYQFQPVTKTFEYLLAGMAVIATDTQENRKVVNESNGVLIADTAEGFLDGLRSVAARRHTYDAGRIRECSASFRWDRIMRSNLLPYLAGVETGVPA